MATVPFVWLLFTVSSWVPLQDNVCHICFETGPRFVSPNYPKIVHSFSHLILNITWIRWSTAFFQLLNFVCLLEFRCFTAFSLPASFIAKTNIFAKIFAIFVTIQKLFLRKTKTNFREIFAKIRAGHSLLFTLFANRYSATSMYHFAIPTPLLF
jgi:hypothetical protein